jgi:Zn-dependent protease with chaperone function
MIWHTNLKTFAFTAGAVIVTGRFFDELHADEQKAIIAHEQGHLYHRHLLKRLWWLVSFQWRDLAARARAQEFEADLYAATKGFADGMISFLERIHPHENPLHPTPEARIEEIERWKTTAPSEPADPVR